MPEREVQVPALPPGVKDATDGYPERRHPFLMQGMLFGHWPQQDPADEPERTKRYETGKQSENLRDYVNDNSAALAAIATRQAAAATGLGAVVRSLDAAVVHRLLIGTGLPNQLETGLLLHPLYGVPYLPGSAIKGITQAFLLASWAAEAGIGRLPLLQFTRRDGPTPLQAFERLLFASVADAARQPDGTLATGDAIWRATRDETRQTLQTSGGTKDQLTAFDAWIAASGRAKGGLYVDLFGASPQKYPGRDQTHSGRRGRVRFLDAFPTALTMATGGQTPHAAPYYREAHKLSQDLPAKEKARVAVPPPDDHFDPVPFAFPLVAAGSRFRVAVAAPDEPLADAAARAVTLALSVDGLGAKRGIGFGRFAVTPA